MILPLPRTGPSRRCRLQLTTKVRLSRPLRARPGWRRRVTPGSSISPSPRKAHVLVGGVLDAPVVQVVVEPGLVDRGSSGPGPSTPSGTPRTRGTGGCGIRRQAAAEPGVAVLRRNPSRRWMSMRPRGRPRVDAGDACPWMKMVAAADVLAAEEVVETDPVQRRRRRVVEMWPPTPTPGRCARCTMMAAFHRMNCRNLRSMILVAGEPRPRSRWGWC